MARPAANKEHYVSNKKMYEVICEYKGNKENKNLLRELASMFLKIATRRLMAPNFCNYSLAWKEDMCSEAVLMMLRKIDNYDPTKISKRTGEPCVIPFAYFSQIAENVFKQYLKDENKKNSIIMNIGYIGNLEENSEESFD